MELSENNNDSAAQGRRYPPCPPQYRHSISQRIRDHYPSLVEIGKGRPTHLLRRKMPIPGVMVHVASATSKEGIYRTAARHDLVRRLSGDAIQLLAWLWKNPLLLPLIGGLIFVIVFQSAYFGINENLYQVRDDGVIVMSHAKNWIDYGFIGVSPSGDRVEGYSAPVQFFIYAISYGISGIDYATFSVIQTVIATFLLGSLFILFFSKHRGIAIILTVLAAWLLTNRTSFLLWHGSGMENAVTHVLFLVSVLIFFRFAESGRIRYPLAIIVFLATISRIESIYHIAPLLLIFAGFWLLKFRSLSGFCFTGIVLLLWGTFNLWRYLYFGDLLPNTAYAQGIDLADNIGVWLSVDETSYLHQLAGRIFADHGGFMLLPALPLAFFITFGVDKIRGGGGGRLLFLLLCSLIATSSLAPLLFGDARLDVTRTTTQLAVTVVLTMTGIFYYICLNNRKHLLWVMPALLIFSFLVIRINFVEPYYLCCGISRFDSYRREFAEIANEESLPRPNVANPDLGVMSWHKQFNITDIGRIGTPIMTKLRHGSGAVFTEYFFDFAAPDLIESHDSWSCHYDESIFSDPRFEQRYQPIWANVSDHTKENCKSNPESLSGIWIRTDILESSESAERRLIDQVSRKLSVDDLRHELEKCQSLPDNNCVYVARTAYRFLPEFRDEGRIDELNELFSASRTSEYDLYLLNGYRDGQAHQDAIEFIKHISSERISTEQ